MSGPHDLNRTIDIPPVTADSLDTGTAGGFTKPVDPLATTDHARGSASTDGSQPGADEPVSGLPAVPGYRVLREIARGGMGRVLAAHDLRLDREVALKILLPGANADRFVRESKITARLPHPGIPPVHALGTLADGSPFLAMKLVAGRTLAAELKTGDRPRLLQAFTQVCQAVGFAHSRGIIHRDLKPANVMVGAFGEVLVMDWGLAKDVASQEQERPERPALVALAGSDPDQTIDQPAPDESTHDQTAAGTVMGTPVYMAPEVAAGHAATRAADVYVHGLGAILYAVFAGRPPYAGATTADVLKKVTTTDPAPIVAPAALAAVCRRAMARNPEDRYASAEELAADVQRWLTDEPVSVYREPWTARAARWGRRRKTSVVAAGVLLVTVAVAATAAAALVWREQQQTKTQWERADGEKVKASENADAAIRVVRDQNRYIKLFESSSNRQTVTDQQRKLTLDQALSGYERLLALNPDDEDMRSTVAVTHRFRANLCRVLGDTGEAGRSYGEAIRLYGELTAAHPDKPSYRIDLAVVSRDYSLQVRALGRLSQSAEILDMSIRLYEELQKSDPDDQENLRRLAIATLDRGELEFQLGRIFETERDARRSMDLFARLADVLKATSEPLDPLFRGMAEIRLAVVLRALGRFDDALAVHDRVVARFAGFLGVQNDNTRTYTFEYHRALAERAVTLAGVPGRESAGVADLDAAIVGCEKLVKQYPQFPPYLRNQAAFTLNRGRLKAQAGQREAAAADLNAAAKIFEGLVAKFKDLPIYRSYLGQTYAALGRLDSDPEKKAESIRKAREHLEGAIRLSPENALDQKALADLEVLAKTPMP